MWKPRIRRSRRIWSPAKIECRRIYSPISGILYANRRDRRKSQSLHRAHLAIFADRGDRRIKPATHLAILYADRGEFDRQRKSQVIFSTDWCGHIWRFFRRSRRCSSFENSCDKIAQPDGLTLPAIRSNDRRKSRERAHLANAGEFNRRYLTYQISAILYADRGNRRKSQSLHWAHLAIFADGGDRRIKSPGVSPALDDRSEVSVGW